MDGWCGLIIFLGRVGIGIGIGGRMGEFDRFYAKFEKRGESFYLFMKNILLCRCIRYHILTSLLLFFFAVSQSESIPIKNIYIFLIYYSPEY